MYIPEIYKETDQKWIQQFIRDNNFGVLVSQVDGRPWATHIPFILRSENNEVKLIAHLSKANPQWKSFDKNEVLVIFEGGNSYISSSWYDHENVPTWNYLAVHAYGTIEILSESERNEAISELVDFHERDQEAPIKMSELSEQTLEELNGTVGIRIKINSFEAVRKLSQNRDDKNHKNICAHLEKKNDTNSRIVADEMKKDRL